MMIKEIISQVLNYSGGIGIVSLFLNNPYFRGPLLRAVNYHSTLSVFKGRLARHFEYFVRNFNVLCEEDLPIFLRGEIISEKPCLLITFDDGGKSNYDVAAKLLDEFGIKGFFFLPVSFIDQSQQSLDMQKRFYLKNIRQDVEKHLSPEEYQPMTWEEAGDLVSRGHAIGVHTFSHISLRENLNFETIEREVVHPKRVLETRFQRKIMSFCWPYGKFSDYSKEAYDLVRKHYDYSFTTFCCPLRPGDDPYTIDRSNVEAYMSLARVKCAVQGVNELYFSRRRRRFKTLLR